MGTDKVDLVNQISRLTDVVRGAVEAKTFDYDSINATKGEEDTTRHIYSTEELFFANATTNCSVFNSSSLLDSTNWACSVRHMWYQ